MPLLTEPLAAARLHLRRLLPADTDALLAYRCRPEVARYQGFEPYSRTDAEALIHSQQRQRFGVPGQWVQLGMVLVATDQLIGDLGVRMRSEEPQLAEVGFTLSPDFQGRGYGTEAVGRLVEFLFTETDTRRIIATTDAENEPSRRLLLRVGFRQEGHFIENTFFKGAWGSEFQFALLRREWTPQSQR